VETRRPFSLAVFLLGLGVVLFAVGAKLALIHRYGTDQPYADQWAFLSSIRKIGRAAVEAIVRDAEARDRVVGVRPALPESDE